MKRILFFIILFCISLSVIAQESCPQVIPALHNGVEQVELFPCLYEAAL